MNLLRAIGYAVREGIGVVGDVARWLLIGLAAVVVVLFALLVIALVVGHPVKVTW